MTSVILLLQIQVTIIRLYLHMFICLYTEINHPWSQQQLADKLALLPDELKQQALQKRLWLDMQLNIGGKLLLKQLLKKIGLENKLLLQDLKFTAAKRPYFDSGLDFNISHSGNIVTCAITDEGRIGVDVEQIKKLNPDNYTEYFTPNEWQHIHDATDNRAGFYHYWTRKEAVLKAIGTGFHTPLDSVDTCEDHLRYDDINYNLTTLQLHKKYKCHIASTVLPGHVKVVKVEV